MSKNTATSHQVYTESVCYNICCVQLYYNICCVQLYYNVPPHPFIPWCSFITSYIMAFPYFLCPKILRFTHISFVKHTFHCNTPVKNIAWSLLVDLSTLIQSIYCDIPYTLYIRIHHIIMK